MNRGTQPAADVVLSAHGVRHFYGRRLVVDVPELGVRTGELLSLLGPNGAGKSTLLRLLAMLETPTTGFIQFGGQRGRRAEAELRSRSTMVFQRPHFWREPVLYNVGLGLRMRGLSVSETRTRVERICQLLGIGHLTGEEVETLSGGEAQRVALARALVLNPDILFLDEPTANLDTAARAALRQDLERVARQRATSIVMVTHDRHEAFYLADRVAVMDGGRIVQVGTPTRLYESPQNPYIAEATGAEFTLRGRVLHADGRTLTAEVEGLRLQVVGDVPVGSSVKIGYRPEDVVLSRPELAIGESSARNLFFATVRERRELGGLVRLRLEGPPDLAAVVTRSAAEQLDLQPDTRVSVRIKATALHAFAAAEGPPGRAGDVRHEVPPGAGDGHPDQPPRATGWQAG